MNDITTLAQMLSEMIEQELEEGATLTDIERATRRSLQELGRLAVALQVQTRAASYPEPAAPCPHCDETADYVRRRAIKLRTLFGEVRVRRAYYLCTTCRQGHCPLDQGLGLRPNALSAELERLAALTGVGLPFRKGRDLFEELTLVSLSDQALAKATRAYGQAVLAREARWQDTAYDAAALQQRERTAKAPLRLYGTIDALKVHTRTREDTPWRDLKVGAWFTARGKPPTSPDGQWRIQAEDLSYYTDICPAAAFGTLLWSTGVQHHAQLARELIFIADGADWIWNLVAEHFPDAVQILDWFHATEYLMPVAKAAFHTEAEQEAWVTAMKHALWEGQLDLVINTCRTLTRLAASSDPAFVAARYYERNRARMDYPSFRRRGYQIGSGTIESAAKQIGTLRLKVAGAIWNEDSARQVAKARAAFLSGQWEALADRRNLPLAF